MELGTRQYSEKDGPLMEQAGKFWTSTSISKTRCFVHSGRQLNLESSTPHPVRGQGQDSTRFCALTVKALLQVVHQIRHVEQTTPRTGRTSCPGERWLLLGLRVRCRLVDIDNLVRTVTDVEKCPTEHAVLQYRSSDPSRTTVEIRSSNVPAINSLVMGNSRGKGASEIMTTQSCGGTCNFSCRLSSMDSL